MLRKNHELQQYLGENNTIDRIKTKHYWKNVDKDVTDYIKHCDFYQKYKTIGIRPMEKSKITDTPENPNDEISMDIFGPFGLT